MSTHVHATRAGAVAAEPVPAAASWMSRPGDRYERDADRMAASALRSPRPDAGTRPAAPLRAGARSPGPLPRSVRRVLGTRGAPLDASVRADLEPRFGHDFGRVRVHADGRADEAARTVGAHAFAVGPRLVFGAGRYAPGEARGRRLLAHELAHVVQGERRATPLLQRKVETEPGMWETSPEPDSPATPEELELPDQIASVDFLGSRVVRFRAVERLAPKLAKLLAAHPGTVVDLVTVRNLLTPGPRGTDPARGLRILLSESFNLPRSRLRTLGRIVDTPPRGLAARKGYARVVVVFPGGKPSPTFASPPPIPPAPADPESAEGVPAPGGLDIDIDLKKVTDHDIDVRIGTFRIRLPRSTTPGSACR